MPQAGVLTVTECNRVSPRKSSESKQGLAYTKACATTSRTFCKAFRSLCAHCKVLEQKN